MVPRVRHGDVLDRDMGVDVGRADRDVPEDCTYVFGAGSALQQMSGARVPQQMRRHALPEPGGLAVFVNEAVERLGAKPAAGHRYEEHRTLVLSAKKARSRFSEIAT